MLIATETFRVTSCRKIRLFCNARCQCEFTRTEASNPEMNLPAHGSGWVFVISKHEGFTLGGRVQVMRLDLLHNLVVHTVKAAFDILHERHVQEPTRIAENGNHLRGLLEKIYKLLTQVLIHLNTLLACTRGQHVMFANPNQIGRELQFRRHQSTWRIHS